MRLHNKNEQRVFNESVYVPAYVDSEEEKQEQIKRMKKLFEGVELPKEHPYTKKEFLKILNDEPL